MAIKDEKRPSQVEQTAHGDDDDEHMHARQKSDLPKDLDSKLEPEAGQNGAELLQSSRNKNRLHAEGQEGPVKEGRPFEGFHNAGIVTPGNTENKSGEKTAENTENKSSAGNKKKKEERIEINKEKAASGNIVTPEKAQNKGEGKTENTENKSGGDDMREEGAEASQIKRERNVTQVEEKDLEDVRNFTNIVERMQDLEDVSDKQVDGKNMSVINMTEASEIAPGGLSMETLLKASDGNRANVQVEELHQNIQKSKASKNQKPSHVNPVQVKEDDLHQKIQKSKATESDLETVEVTEEMDMNDSREMTSESVEARQKIMQSENQTQPSGSTFDPQNGDGSTGESENLHDDAGNDGMSTLVGAKKEVEEVVNQLGSPNFLNMELEEERGEKKEEEEKEKEEEEKERKKGKEEEDDKVINELNAHRRFLTLEEKARALGLEVILDTREGICSQILNI